MPLNTPLREKEDRAGCHCRAALQLFFILTASGILHRRHRLCGKVPNAGRRLTTGHGLAASPQPCPEAPADGSDRKRVPPASASPRHLPKRGLRMVPFAQGERLARVKAAPMSCERQPAFPHCPTLLKEDRILGFFLTCLG